jgi:hypothetical protein
MPQVAEDYEQVSPCISLPPSFIDTAATAFEERGRAEDLIHLLGRDVVVFDVLNPIDRSLQVINSHGASAMAADLFNLPTTQFVNHSITSLQRVATLSVFLSVDFSPARKSAVTLKYELTATAGFRGRDPQISQIAPIQSEKSAYSADLICGLDRLQCRGVWHAPRTMK